MLMTARLFTNVSKIELIVFDCDGVILDSVDIKTNAFAALFEEFGPDVVQKVVDYHLANGGVSRYEKFAYYYRELLDQDISDQLMMELDKRFNQSTFEGILKAPYIPGSYEFISQNYQRWPLYVASGAPENELQKIFEERRLTQFFKDVYGSPTPKKKILEKIVHENSVNPKQTLMIGDSSSDLEAAHFVGTHFLGIGPFCKPNVWMKDLVNLESYVKDLS